MDDKDKALDMIAFLLKQVPDTPSSLNDSWRSQMLRWQTSLNKPEGASLKLRFVVWPGIHGAVKMLCRLPTPQPPEGNPKPRAEVD